LGNQFEENFFFLLADGTGGGILVASRSSMFHLYQPKLTQNTITPIVHDVTTDKTWTLIGVYGPQGSLEKSMFLRELRWFRHQAKPQWLIMGDFNMIYQSQDKNNGRLNSRLML
jgi:exonuclease III